MKRVILIIALSFLSLQCISPVFAQEEDTLFDVNDKERVLRFAKQNYNFTWMMTDYDNPDNLMIAADHDVPYVAVHNLDNNLNILDSIGIQDSIQLQFKMNNLLYGVGFYHKNSAWIIDSMLLFCYGLDGNKVFIKKIFDSNGDSIFFNYYDEDEHHFFVTKEKNIFIYLHKYYANYDSPEYDYNRFILVDTLGNILKDRAFTSTEIDDFWFREKGVAPFGAWTITHALIEHKDNFEYILSQIADSSSFSVFFDKQTLEVIDSASYGDSLIVIQQNYIDVNDSIGVSLSRSMVRNGMPTDHYVNIYVIDYKNHNVLHTSKFYYNENEIEPWYPIQFQKTIDFTNLDSIYYCYSGFDNTLHLVNFSVSGIINYQYDFEFYANNFGQLIGIKATSDGGVAISVLTDNVYNINSNVIKFDPYGRVSLEGVQGDKPMLVSYPNPAKDNINFSCSDVIEELEIFNLLGQKVYASKVKDKFVAVDVSGFVSGNYVAKIHTDKGIITKKFVVE
ncbi:MAG: T9SS type A sorting domain-containing protein [Bacteroidales bacterium]|jgi:hypothetical protein|nr:T9SS type A sorting domain-containing protein [Bacteroidales bacterium]